MYPRPYIVFYPKGVIQALKNDIGRDEDTYDQLHYMQYLVALLFTDLPSLSPFISYLYKYMYACLVKMACGFIVSEFGGFENALCDAGGLSYRNHPDVMIYKCKNRNEGDRDGKSAKRSATRSCL